MTSIDELIDNLEKAEMLADVIESTVAPKVCNEMRNTAIRKLTLQKARDTGKLVNSISAAQNLISREDSTVVTMGIETDTEYAKYIEFGTGINGSSSYGGHDNPQVTFKRDRVDWVYFDEEDGEFRTAHAQHPRPFMRPALYDKQKEYEDMMLKAAMKVIA